MGMVILIYLLAAAIHHLHVGSALGFIDLPRVWGLLG